MHDIKFLCVNGFLNMDLYLNKNIQVDGNNIHIRLVSILYCKIGLSDTALGPPPTTSTAVMEKRTASQVRQICKERRKTQILRLCFAVYLL